MSASDKAGGKADELKGKVKEKVGDATDNRDLQAEGVADQASGKAEQVKGDVKQAGEDVTR
ncbi:MAG: CsbD family protein [Microlunatus sp.]|nr:CsbD family protein [Microlunatus sp.]MDN5770136.1 CsbD family protein [Microlunatus sp.]